jgi:hypothetical protein
MGMRYAFIIIGLILSAISFADTETNLRLNSYRLHFTDLRQTDQFLFNEITEINPIIRHSAENGRHTELFLYFAATSYLIDYYIQTDTNKRNREMYYLSWIVIESIVTSNNLRKGYTNISPYISYTWRF